jgi:hypothetical protein
MPGCGRYQLPASTSGETAAARDILPPSGLTSIKPEISCFSDWITAGPLALSSTSLAPALGYFADIVRMACMVPGMSRRLRTWSSR